LVFSFSFSSFLASPLLSLEVDRYPYPVPVYNFHQAIAVSQFQSATYKMRSSILLAPALAAVTYAAPTYPQLNMDAAMPSGLEVMSDYFNMLAEKVQANRYMSSAPLCEMSKVSMPAGEFPPLLSSNLPHEAACKLTHDLPAAAGLPPPSKGLSLKHIAIGRGTQNYTCDVTNSTAVPAAAGAVATLFNASCVAATYPDLLAILPRVSMQFNLTSDESPRMGPSNLAISGKHFFTNGTTPFFNLDTPAQQLGEAPCAKNSSIPAPADSPKGQKGEPAVAWLKLLTRAGATGGLQEVYRLGTAGGSPPATCAGMPATFEVQYAAEYWFYEGPAPVPEAPKQ
jgi:hypothetical protein